MAEKVGTSTGKGYVDKVYDGYAYSARYDSYGNLIRKLNSYAVRIDKFGSSDTGKENGELMFVWNTYNNLDATVGAILDDMYSTGVFTSSGCTQYPCSGYFKNTNGYIDSTVFSFSYIPPVGGMNTYQFEVEYCLFNSSKKNREVQLFEGNSCPVQGKVYKIL